MSERRHFCKYIYGLRDPRDSEMFYVGQSRDPVVRLLAHIQEARGIEKSKRILALMIDGTYPALEILETLDYHENGVYRSRDEEVSRRELYWMGVWKSRGHRLLNRDQGKVGNSL